MKHLVSIIIPVYNKAAFVEETILSALGQTYPYTEIILINDGSTDDSLKILKRYQQKDPHKIILIDQENQGVSKATNRGIKESKGEYIQFLDADDILSPDKIQRQIDLIKDNEKDVVASCEWLMFKDNIDDCVHIPYGVFENFDSGLDLLLQFWNKQEMHQPGIYLTHRTLIEQAGPWNELLSINQDGEFFCRVLLRAGKIKYAERGKVYYRTPGESNVSQQKSKKAWCSLLDSLQCYERETLKVEDSPRVRKALKKIYQKFIYDVFPAHPELVAQAESYIENLGIAEKTYIGGPKFQILSKYLGFKNALRLKRLFN